MGRKLFTVLAATLGLVLAIGVGPLSARTSPQTPKGEGVSMETCANCHKETVVGFQHTPHMQSALKCEGCHGDAKAHVDAGGDKTKIRRLGDLAPQEASAVCLACHSKGKQTHWVGSAHDSRNVACTACHNPHPKEGNHQRALLTKPQFELCTSCHLQKKAALMRSGHMPMREGKINCTTCHNPHGTPFEKQLYQVTPNENCYSCHADKRGPHLYEHPPVRENCMNCHDAHGSVHDYLLKVKQPLLCQQCHIATRHPGQLHVQDRYSLNKGCINCHPKVHGSNHPTGNTFWR